MISHKKRFGFTLAELMMVFFAIGIISFIGISTVKAHKKQVYHLYNKAYDVLYTAAYNVFADESQDYNFDDPHKLCLGLTKYINSADKVDDDGHFACGDVGARVTSETRVVADKLPDFIANNGMRFYISNKQKFEKFKDTENLESDIEYYLVFADLDGNRGKGRVIETLSNDDEREVVAFVLTSNGDVIPLGVPSLDKNYLAVQVVYPNDDDDTEHPMESYYQATYKAWGDISEKDSAKNKYTNSTLNDYRTIPFNSFLNNSSALKIKTSGPSGTLVYPAGLTKSEECPEFDCDIKIKRFF